MKDFDRQMLEWSLHHGLPVHILLTKADKLKRGAAANSLQQARKETARFGEQVSLQLFSSLNRQGLDEVHGVLDGWLELDLYTSQ
jgi:GTP-binding protein